MRKSQILGLAAATVAGLSLAACSSSSSGSSNVTGGLPSGVSLPAARVKSLSSSSPAWKADTGHAKTLTWFVDQTWWNTNFGSDLVTKTIEKDLNVKINFVVGDDTKLATYFASGQLPDLITNDSMTNQAAQTASKWALPLQTLANKYDPYFNTVAASQTMDWYKMSNGYTYGYPNYSNTSADYKSGKIMPETGFVIRKDIYDALGKPDMSTPDKFVAVMKEIKAKYPNLITFGFSDAAQKLQDMLGVPYYQNGKWVDRTEDPDYLKWLDAFRQVHAFGGISDDQFNTSSNTTAQNISSGKYAAYFEGQAINDSASFQQLLANHPDEQYTAVTAIKSTEGRKPVLSQAGISGWLSTYITKDCKDPEAAIELESFLLSDEGQMLVNYGVKGQTYTQSSDGKVTINPTVSALMQSNPTAAAKQYNLGGFILFGHDRYKALDPSAAFAPALTTFFDWGKGYLTSEFPSENVAPAANTVEARNYLAITDPSLGIQTKLPADLIRASSESQFKSVLSNYETGLKNYNWEGIKTDFNKQVQANLKKLGMSSTASTVSGQ